MKEPGNEGRKKRKFWQTLLISAIIILIYAYAMDATQINLEEPLKPKRQENLVTMIRELVHPDIFSFKNETRSTNISVRMPCPVDVKGSQTTVEGRVLVLSPNCASTTQDVLTLRGEGFQENVQGAILWYPAGSDTTRRLADLRTDDTGNFTTSFAMPDIRETEEPQQIEVVEILNQRITGFSESTKITADLIVETILMALMASTIGTILAVPISFLAARNLMADVKSPLAAIMTALILVPFGAWLALKATGWIVDLSDLVVAQSFVGGAVAMGVAIGLAWLVMRVGKSALVETDESLGNRVLNVVRIIAATALMLFAAAIVAQFGILLGAWLRDVLGPFSFIGNFINVLGGFVRILLPLFVGFVGALLAASYGHRFGQEMVMHTKEGRARWITAVLTFFGSLILVYTLLYAINWICLLGVCHNIPEDIPLFVILGIPSFVVGVITALLSLRNSPKKQYGTGIITYTIMRGILNGLRSIEPVIMGFVLVVWVGLGPFAGVMALILHSIADLGKLFSEQVENIAEGPVEAITATGANRFQMIVFAVIPQVVPHYIAFAFYRWDINVRMSTIIGFVGGGGIGFVLFRNTNLTQYRQAAVMVIAIALVVVVLDYFSSRLRRRIT